jgi:hypothetical protein
MADLEANSLGEVPSNPWKEKGERTRERPGSPRVSQNLLMKNSDIQIATKVRKLHNV